MIETRLDGGRKALGRGLAALIPGAQTTATGQGLRAIPIERIRPNRAQPRKHFAEESLAELALSMRQRGVLQPVVVRQRGEGYELVAGERRWRAAQQAGLTEIPAVIKELSDAEALQVALIENLQREDLDALEEAAAYARLIDEHHMTQEAVAEAVGKSRAAVANSLRLLKLPPSLVAMLAAGRLSAGHARALMTLDNDKAMQTLADKIVERGWSVREAEREARLLSKPTRAAPKKRGTPAEAQVETRLERALGTKVRLRHRHGKGRIEIFFHSLDQLDDLLRRLAR